MTKQCLLMFLLPDLSLWEVLKNLHFIYLGGGACACQRTTPWMLILSVSQVGGDEAHGIGVASRPLYLLSQIFLASVYGNFVGTLLFSLSFSFCLFLFLSLYLSYSLGVCKSEDNLREGVSAFLPPYGSQRANLGGSTCCWLRPLPAEPSCWPYCTS